MNDNTEDFKPIEAHLGGVATLAGTIGELTLAASEPSPLTPTDLLTITTPEGSTRETLDLEKYCFQPRRPKGIVKPFSLDDLIRYVKRHDDDVTSTFWLQPDQAHVTAVLNDHGEGGHQDEHTAQWGDWRAELALRPTAEWTLLTQFADKQHPQYAFAEFVEELTHVIEEPDAADLFEMAQTFHAHRTADFSQIQRLKDGTISVGYHEELEASAGGEKGRIAIPEVIVFFLPPFEGEEPVRIKALLRYRLNGPKLTLGIKLIQPDEVIREIFERMQKRLGEEFDAKRVFLGTPRSA